MGTSKQQREEYIERDWSAPNKMVCANCVDDEFLKDLIRNHLNARRCEYCGTRTRKRSAAPVKSIMPAIASTLKYLYADPASVGVPSDSEFPVGLICTIDALHGIPFVANDLLVSDIEKAFENPGWVPAVEGVWMSDSYSEECYSAWAAFVHRVKHRSRYFFTRTAQSPDVMRRSGTLDILETIGSIAEQLGLFLSIPEKTRLFRVRERLQGANWGLCAAELGAPPNRNARAGRMNPAGIAYLYLSTSERGALAEVFRGPPAQVAVGTFETVRPLLLLDLTSIPSVPSIFDETKRSDRDGISFLVDFRTDICSPIQKDGFQHIEYVPPQVVSEFFAQVFTSSLGGQLDGIRYPSAALRGGVNLALFPRSENNPFQSVVSFVSGREISLPTWTEYLDAFFE